MIDSQVQVVYFPKIDLAGPKTATFPSFKMNSRGSNFDQEKIQTFSKNKLLGICCSNIFSTALSATAWTVHNKHDYI